MDCPEAKTWGEMTVEEKLVILEALLRGKPVEVYSLFYENDVLVRDWYDTHPRFFYDDIPIRIRKDD